MKAKMILTGLAALTLTTGCHAHKADKVVVVKKPHTTRVVLIDNDHQRSDYTIVRVKPKKNRVCKKHRQHWHCI
jgi:hypothetical protein